MKLIIGLGNPGKEYERTRHNAGWLALDEIANTFDGTWSEDSKHNAIVAKIRIGKETVVLAKPTTYMNLSGQTVRSLLAFYKVLPSHVLIIQDEMDVMPGDFKFSAGGGTAGHNGIESVVAETGRKDFARLRLGIGRTIPPMKTEDWVLGKIDPKTVDVTKETPAMIQDWVEKGLEAATNKWHTKKAA